MTEIKIYQCEICQHRSQAKAEIERCEKGHVMLGSPSFFFEKPRSAYPSHIEFDAGEEIAIYRFEFSRPKEAEDD